MRDNIGLVVDNLLAFADRFSKEASNVLIAFAAIGTLTMAILQIVKDLTPVRSWFNRWKVGSWLKGDVGALADLVALATAGDRGAFYDLELERLAGQISAAAGVVVDNPGLHPALLRRLAAQARDKDLQLLSDKGDEGWLTKLLAGPPDDYQLFLAAKARVVHQVQRNIDGFQISATFTWKTYFQVASFVISAMLTTIALWIQGDIFQPGVIFVVSIAAGVFAPIARDLVSILSKAKKT